MAEPARESAADREQEQARKLDPRKLIWADVRTAIIICARAAELAVTELAHRPGDDPALAMAGLTRQAFENAIELGRRWELDEAVMAAAERQAQERERRAYDEGYAARKAERCRLEVVDGGLVP